MKFQKFLLYNPKTQTSNLEKKWKKWKSKLTHPCQRTWSRPPYLTLLLLGLCKVDSINNQALRVYSKRIGSELSAGAYRAWKVFAIVFYSGVLMQTKLWHQSITVPLATKASIVCTAHSQFSSIFNLVLKIWSYWKWMKLVNWLVNLESKF